MKKRLISILLALCMVLALVPGTAGASIDDESYSYKTTITTSNVTVGRDNYSCDVSMTTGEIMPHICKVVDNRLQKFAVLHDGDAITVYPNKYGATSNGKYIYILMLRLEAGTFMKNILSLKMKTRLVLLIPNFLHRSFP